MASSVPTVTLSLAVVMLLVVLLALGGQECNLMPHAAVSLAALLLLASTVSTGAFSLAVVMLLVVLLALGGQECNLMPQGCSQLQLALLPALELMNSRPRVATWCWTTIWLGRC